MTRRLFDKTVAKTSKAVVTEYAWDAGTCDPCPGPVITAAEIASLGGDVLPSAKPPPDVGNQIARPGVRPRPFRSGMFSGFVLTRLHARYSKESLGEDLVFKAAPPIAGGRVNRSANGELEHGSIASSNNDFQGRYAIHHAWGGPIACSAPVRGRWGGPPGQGFGYQPSKPALNLAFAARDVALPAYVRSEIPELGIKGEGFIPSPAMPAAVPFGEPEKKKGCLGCAMTERQAPNDALALTATALAIFVVRRRRAT